MSCEFIETYLIFIVIFIALGFTSMTIFHIGLLDRFRKVYIVNNNQEDDLK